MIKFFKKLLGLNKSVTINVTQEDIDKGIRFASGACPIALAASRAFKKKVIVGDALFVYNKEYVEKKYKLPYEADMFISNFDSGYSVSPFSFEVKSE